LQAFKNDPPARLREWLPEVTSLVMGRVAAKMVSAQPGRGN
jgi:hypothetical protein